MGRVRIIGGSNRSRILEFSDNIVGLRPTTDKVRETLFNWLGQNLDEKRCLDLFAGSGAIGFEALSRGASFVTMVDINASAVDQLIRNKKNLKCSNVAIIRQDGLAYLSSFNEKVDIVFLDPPYNTTLLEKSLQIILEKKHNFKNSIIYAEYSGCLNTTNYQIIKHKKAGIANYSLLKLAF